VARLLERLAGDEKRELDEIDAAQARLEAVGFGVCERCRDAIPIERLRAIPFTRHCLACQAGEER
jgi:DnaK suppressor protein